MTLPPLLTLSFWFDPNPPPFIPVADKAILAILFVAVAAGIVLSFMLRKKFLDKLNRQINGRIVRLLFTFGFVGLLLYGLAYERVAYLSMRIWWVPFGAWIIWDAWRMWRFTFVKVPQIRKMQDEKAQFEKWLPKRKK